MVAPKRLLGRFMLSINIKLYSTFRYTSFSFLKRNDNHNHSKFLRYLVFFNPQSNTANNPAGSLWHSGMSPNRYKVVLLEPMVTKCYGCGSAFSERFRSSPFNVILKHVDRRITGKNYTGQFQYCSDYSST